MIGSPLMVLAERGTWNLLRSMMPLPQIDVVHRLNCDDRPRRELLAPKP